MHQGEQRELQTIPKQDLSQQHLHTHGPTGMIAGGGHIAPLLARICFDSCVAGVLVLDLIASPVGECWGRTGGMGTVVTE